MHRVRRAFEAFDDLDQDLTQFIEFRICSQVWSIPSVMVMRHWAWARLTRHLKMLIRLSCMGVESIWILEFLSDHTKLSALWSRGSCPDFSCIRSHEIWGFECWSNHASLSVYFWLSVWAVRCCSHLARSCEVFHNWGRDVVYTNTSEILFHYMKYIWVHNGAIWLKYWPHEPMQ
jgi:hypothetical protein